MEKPIKIGKAEYVLGKYSLRAKQDILNQSTKVEIKAGGVSREILMGTYQTLVVFHSLKRWNLKDKDEKDLPITLDNFYEYVPAEHLDELFITAETLNTVGEPEKNAS